MSIEIQKAVSESRKVSDGSGEQYIVEIQTKLETEKAISYQFITILLRTSTSDLCTMQVLGDVVQPPTKDV